MTTETLTFTKHFVDQVNGKYGLKTKNTFVTNDNRRFETWRPDVAAQVAAYLNQPVTVVYEQRVNGQYTNLVIQGVVNDAAPAPSQQTSPPPANVSSASQAKEISIQRQSALKAAIHAFEVAGIDPVTEHAALVEWAETVAFDYFVNGFQRQEAE